MMHHKKYTLVRQHSANVQAVADALGRPYPPFVESWENSDQIRMCWEYHVPERTALIERQSSHLGQGSAPVIRKADIAMAQLKQDLIEKTGVAVDINPRGYIIVPNDTQAEEVA